MAAGFPLLTDNNVRQPVVEGLRKAGWNVVRTVDVAEINRGRGKDDTPILEYAVREGRVLVTNDHGILGIAKEWLLKGRVGFRMIYWWQPHHGRMSDGDFIRAIIELASKPDAFAYPVEYIKPKSKELVRSGPPHASG